MQSGICERRWLRCIYKEKIDLKKLIVILGIGIIASCVGCGSSGGMSSSDTENSSETAVTEEISSEDTISEDTETKDTVSEDTESTDVASDNTAMEGTSKYNAFIDDYLSFEVTSTSLNNGVWDDVISYTDKGENKSPQLEWSAVDGAALYVIIMDDPNAGDFMHWKSDNVTETSLDEGWAPKSDYMGPYPPGGVTHTYEVYVVALRAPVERIKGTFNASNPKFEENFKALDTDAEGNSGNIIAVGRLSGTFTN